MLRVKEKTRFNNILRSYFYIFFLAIISTARVLTKSKKQVITYLKGL